MEPTILDNIVREKVIHGHVKLPPFFEQALYIYKNHYLVSYTSSFDRSLQSIFVSYNTS